ncbi:hypothetical protein A3D00_04750 [Candidatus Woesebacteria bacterium RIFCSPHIGHO2_02_FULL_38_9]|uniref:Glycosyltransferase 2-like domain-containing protein n=1 Tax=Candidatus Woesebacteria bacterium RIFCSPHIGHO2_01_FULL_39_28 TaxID=1802496 RepID=A0A1F7YHJ2_9BACT|nr:MAG: hypothetical protein A2627_04110 [Candidatus Woesebacteria bacterium RIFCSPHIGHO2_01_FULL_39_28]OGM34915.1 MAG: hypothetical protein A3D00_04750 [Candidatus Woesebacteria bacterium RIFCSPHIGHO2_02_FULL_38_9]OGM58680.1 MAG: hypothetical protein A3A50_02765 [Candidatus Woesebacteria bacterium RIFCSPLOWO2_01_FULL_38_20]
MKIDIFPVKKNLSSVMRNLVSEFGVPQAQKDLAIYCFAKDQTGNEIHLRFRNKKCLLFYIAEKTDELFRPRINIDMNRTTMKSLLTLFKEIGYDKASIGIATCFEYYSSNQLFIELLVDTFIGDFVQIGYENDKIADKFKAKLSNLGLNKINKPQVKSLVGKRNIKYYEIINQLGVVNDLIYKFTKDVGLSLEPSITSLKSKISNFSNDYSYLESAFFKLFDHELLTIQGFDPAYSKLIQPVSIVIPCFNSNETFIKTLYSLSCQNLPLGYINKLDVILVDDSSGTPIRKIIKKNELGFKFECKTVCFNPNMGLSNARNAGVSIAKNDIVIFLDSDIVLSENYLLEHCLRNIFIPNAVFVSFKKNLDKNDERISFKSIEKGLNSPDIYSDLRVRKVVDEGSPGMYEVSGKVAVEILNQSNYFKDLGNGRSLGIYDLPSMVIGHNMSCRKDNVYKIGGFSNEFRGWGLEDSYFGARMIAEGNFVIPILSTGVYHIDHPPRSGSFIQKKNELQANLKRYKELLNQPY